MTQATGARWGNTDAGWRGGGQGREGGDGEGMGGDQCGVLGEAHVVGDGLVQPQRHHALLALPRRPHAGAAPRRRRLAYTSGCTGDARRRHGTATSLRRAQTGRAACGTGIRHWRAENWEKNFFSTNRRWLKLSVSLSCPQAFRQRPTPVPPAAGTRCHGPLLGPPGLGWRWCNLKDSDSFKSLI